MCGRNEGGAGRMGVQKEWWWSWQDGCAEGMAVELYVKE